MLRQRSRRISEVGHILKWDEGQGSQPLQNRDYSAPG